MLMRCAMCQCPSAGWTISVRTPPVDLGWTKATREPRMPVRGVSSMQRDALGPQRVERGLDVGHLVGDVVQARARAWPGTCPTGVSGPSGASSSTWFSPTSSRTASTPCSSTTSRWTSAQLEAPS